MNSFPRGLDLFISGGSRIGFSYPIQQSRLYPWDHMAQVRRRINGRGQHDEHSGEGGVQGGVQRGWAPPIPPSIKYVMPHHKVDHGRTPYADFVQADCLKGSSREKAKQYTAHLRPSSTLLPPSLCTCIINYNVTLKITCSVNTKHYTETNMYLATFYTDTCMQVRSTAVFSTAHLT